MSVNYAQGHAYSDAIVRAGGLPVLLPIIGDKTVLRALYERCDGILFAGGEDLNPKLFGQAKHPKTGSISDARDEQEMKLLTWSLDDIKPLLGICRGMQLLNVHLGGTLYQHIPEAVPNAQNHEVSEDHQNTAQIAHNLALKPDSQLAALLGSQPVHANSQHHQAVDVVGSGLIVTARAEDGIVEAIELPGKPFVIAVQPHPEGIEADVEPRWQALFSGFVKAAAHDSPHATATA